MGARPALELRRTAPTELDQIGVVIVEEQLGLKPTDLDGLRAISARLPFEPCMSLLSILAGRVEETMNRPDRQLEIAEGFFGESVLVERYRELVRGDETAHIFAPQSLYTLMRVLIDEAFDAPVTHDLPLGERLALMEAVVASNSVIERGLDTTIGPNREDLLAYELQVGHYYSRPTWMEEMARARELFRLATEDPDLIASADFVPVKDWIERSGLTAEDQWILGFALSAVTNAWDASKHPHVPAATVAEVLERTGLEDRAEAALAVISADRRPAGRVRRTACPREAVHLGVAAVQHLALPETQGQRRAGVARAALDPQLVGRGIPLPRRPGSAGRGRRRVRG
jgi:hypothetical protein